MTRFIELTQTSGREHSAGQVGPQSTFLNEPNAPERASAEALGNALFANESFEQWTGLFGINISSIHFVTMAFLGLLAKASEEDEDWSANVINITSISGHTKVAQCHVSIVYLTGVESKLLNVFFAVCI